LKRKTPTSKPHPTPAELGQMLINIYESGYLDRVQSYKMSFIKGVLGGLGGVIGATIVVAVLLWVLSFLHDVPLLNRFSDNVRHTLQAQRK
jgi:hypothetical protein